jgi:ubiquinone/menaquinone biosynthesis C-methylase UbiE
MPGLIDDLDLLLAPAPSDTKGVYDRVADRYEQFRSLWVRLAGNAVERPMLEELDDILAPGLRVLDAGCGTGTLSHRMKAMQPAIDLTLLDFSSGMLAHTRDIPASRVQGSVLALPFPDNTFDVVVSSWVIETVPDPMQAVSEYLRVINETGYVLYTFCSLPAGWVSKAGTALLRSTIEHRFGGTFLPPARTPWHDCERSFRLRSHAGLTTFVSLRKCCTVGEGVLPEPVQDTAT